MKRLTLIFFLSFFSIHLWASTFRYAIPYEPQSLDPAESVVADSQHFLSNLFRGLFTIDDQGRLVPEGVDRCQWHTRLRLQCHLKQLKFSDGTSIIAQDYATAFRHMLRKETKTPEAELLVNVKNVKAMSQRELIFNFKNVDPEFEYKLASPLLFPWRVLPTFENIHSIPVNGPYKVKLWEKGKRILLEPNLFAQGHKARPNLEIRFVADETALLAMFDSGNIDFVRRLPTLTIERYRKHPGFRATPLSRFDYLGFGPQLKNSKELRKAMTNSLDYEEFKKLFNSTGRPGCPSFSENYMEGDHCYQLGRKEENTGSGFHKLKFLISQSGGQDLIRSAEWFQNQWSKKLGLEVEIQTMESSQFLAEIRTHPPDIFRMGVSLSRPTCLAAMELFKSNSENNLVHVKDEKLDRLILDLEKLKSSPAKKKLCGKVVDRLLDLHVLIPLGRFQFFMVMSDKFEGLGLNELNQLDLSQLHPKAFSN